MDEKIFRQLKKINSHQGRTVFCAGAWHRRWPPTSTCSLLGACQYVLDRIPDFNCPIFIPGYLIPVDAHFQVLMCFKPHSSFQSPPFFIPEYLIKETRQVRQQLRDQTLQTTIYSMESATQMTFTTYSRFPIADDDNCVDYGYECVSHVHTYYYILNISFPSI